MAKLFFYDLETTGVNFWRHGIHQISGAIVIDGEIKERFDFKVKPHEKAIIENDALAVGNVGKEQILAYPLMSEVYKNLTSMLAKYCNKFDKKDKFHLVGYNINSFDNAFFRAFFVQNNDNYFGSWFWSDSIDCMVLASNKLRSKRTELIDFKQKTVAAYLGIEVEEAKLHEAQYDIDLCMQIFEKVSQ